MPFGIFSRKKSKIPLITVSLDGKKLCEIYDLPTEEMPSAKIESAHPILSFTDSDGQSYKHDLTSVLEDGCSWIHLSVRVHEGFACQADCLINNANEVDDTDFKNGDVKGIRFQPFYLPQCTAKPQDLIGQGLFFRGLHFSGTITPGNVSVSCICDFCHKSFRLQSFHAGFGENSYFYCSKGPHTLVISSYVKGAPAPLSNPDDEALSHLEECLPKCSDCGGNFKYNNSYLCPHCKKPFINFVKHPEIRDNEYYGNILYGKKYQEWQEEEANQ